MRRESKWQSSCCNKCVGTVQTEANSITCYYHLKIQSNYSVWQQVLITEGFKQYFLRTQSAIWSSFEALAHHNKCCKKCSHPPYTLQLFITTEMMFSTIKFYMGNNLHNRFLAFVNLIPVAEQWLSTEHIRPHHCGHRTGAVLSSDNHCLKEIASVPLFWNPNPWVCQLSFMRDYSSCIWRIQKL